LGEGIDVWRRGVKFPPVSVLGCFVGRVGGAACLINGELLHLFKDVALAFLNVFGDGLAS